MKKQYCVINWNGDQLGIDGNKSLMGTVISSQRRYFATSPVHVITYIEFTDKYKLLLLKRSEERIRRSHLE